MAHDAGGVGAKPIVLKIGAVPTRHNQARVQHLCGVKDLLVGRGMQNDVFHRPINIGPESGRNNLGERDPRVPERLLIGSGLEVGADDAHPGNGG